MGLVPDPKQILKKNNSRYTTVGGCYVNNTHAHIYLSVPPKYDFDSVVNMMKDEWKKLDDRFDVKFDIHSETVQFEERYASYSVREFDIYNPNTFEVI